MRILVIGATGVIGAPVARQLAADGFDVRLLVRDATRGRSRLGPEFEYVEGDVADQGSVEQAVRGCDGVHVSLAAATRNDMDRVERQGTATIAQAAASSGVYLLTYVSGSLVHAQYGQKIPEHAAKVAAEQAIRTSGVPFVFFRPTYFMDNLGRHIQGRRAVALGRPRPLHMVAASDFATMVSRAFRAPDVAGCDLAIHGPEPVTIAEALRVYCRAVEPDTRVVTVPLGVMKGIDRVFMGGKLRANLELMALLQRLGEQGDPAEANRLLGAPATTVRQWCENVVPKATG